MVLGIFSGSLFGRSKGALNEFIKMLFGEISLPLKNILLLIALFSMTTF
jgi:hypothetical protein